MKNYKIYFMILLGVALASCEKKFDAPKLNEPYEATPTMTIGQLKALHQSGGVKLADEIVVKGRVTSSDRFGNFYRSFYISDGTDAIEIKHGGRALYNNYPPGMEIYIVTTGNDLYLGDYGGMKSIGAKSNNPAKYENAWIDVAENINSSIKTGSFIPVSASDTIVVASLAECANHLGKLVRMENMRFEKNAELDTWGDPEDSDNRTGNLYGEQYIFFGAGSDKVVVRTSGYAKFAADKITDLDGKRVDITGVMTQYKTYQTTYQLILNSVSASDLKVRE